MQLLKKQRQYKNTQTIIWQNPHASPLMKTVNIYWSQCCVLQINITFQIMINSYHVIFITITSLVGGSIKSKWTTSLIPSAISCNTTLDKLLLKILTTGTQGFERQHKKKRLNSVKSAWNAKYGLKLEKLKILAPVNFEKQGNQLKRWTLTALGTIWLLCSYCANRSDWWKRSSVVYLGQKHAGEGVNWMQLPGLVQNKGVTASLAAPPYSSRSLHLQTKGAFIYSSWRGVKWMGSASPKIRQVW